MLNNPPQPSHTQSKTNNSLIVRVKRKRNINASESLFDQICIIEDFEPEQKKSLSSNRLTKSFSKLSYDNSAATNVNSHQTNNRFVILTRVNTINKSENNENSKISVDDLIVRNTDNILQNHHQYENEASTNRNSSNVMFVPSKKRVLHSSSSERYLVVDMTQVEINNTNNNNKEAKIFDSDRTQTSSSSSNQRIKTVILDPVTRQLNGAILLANKSGDFNGVVLALSHGANINHRTDVASGGWTALMVAVKHGNLRVIKRLLSQTCDVFILNEAGQTALDIARQLTTAVDPSLIPTSISITETNKFEIQQWLHRAALKQHHSQSQSYSRNQQFHSPSHNPHPTTSPFSTAGTAGMETIPEISTDDMMMVGAAESEDDYVYDIYHAMSTTDTTPTITSPQPTTTDECCDTSANPASASSTRPVLLSGFQGPIVPVEGLRIDDDSGNVELVFEYDSDWSALGEDDDSDSNAENHPSECLSVVFIFIRLCVFD